MSQKAEKEEQIREFEEAISSLEEINRVLMERVERSTDSAGSAFSLFETNILLQQRVHQHTDELEQSNLKLQAEISERKRVESELRESHARFRDIALSTSDWLWEVDAQGRYTFCSEKVESVLGYTPQEIMGKTPFDLMSPGDAERISRQFKNLAAERAPIVDLENWNVHKDGHSVCLLTSGIPILDAQGNLMGYRGTDKDITERKRAEAALRESEERLRILFDNLTIGVYRTTPDGRVLTANAALVKMLGFSSFEELAARNLETDGFGPINPRSHFKQLVEQKGLIRGLESAWHMHDGRVIYVRENARVVRGKNGEILCYEGTVEDISERLRIEEEKRKLETHLRQAQKMEAIGTLAGGIAHDFNNILMAMLGCTDMAMYDIPRDSAAYANLEEVLKAGLRAKDLVLQILTFSRQMEQERQPVAVPLIVKEALKLIRASLPVTIEIRHSIENECGAVLGDATQIHQVIMNLCTNAYHAMRDKGGILEVKVESFEVDAEFARAHANLREGQYVRIVVSDTGHGMDKATQERIFEPFFTTKGVGEGTGMGLATVHGIVSSYRGTISVYSELGKGTTFQIYLPQIRRATLLETSPENSPAKGQETILFVDDEVGLTRIGQQMLERMGYNVTTRTSSIEALELFRARPVRFDLVITDMTMPNMTGIELAEELIRIRRDLPIILVTGFSETVTPEKVKKLGIREFIMKPIISRDLGRVIRKVLDESNDKEKEKKTKAATEALDSSPTLW
jgi:PAS domain S-box-containing protein